jgi:hypothetical protein
MGVGASSDWDCRDCDADREPAFGHAGRQTQARDTRATRRAHSDARRKQRQQCGRLMSVFCAEICTFASRIFFDEHRPPARRHLPGRHRSKYRPVFTIGQACRLVGANAGYGNRKYQRHRERHASFFGSDCRGANRVPTCSTEVLCLGPNSMGTGRISKAPERRSPPECRGL